MTVRVYWTQSLPPTNSSSAQMALHMHYVKQTPLVQLRSRSELHNGKYRYKMLKVISSALFNPWVSHTATINIENVTLDTSWHSKIT